MNIVLIGFMGSGKSRVASALAKKMGRNCVDTDDLIVKKAGCSISEIFKRQGEDAFRRLETDAVQAAADEIQAVIATGGGVPLNPDNFDRLSHNGFVVWLKVSPEVVLKRAGDLSSRPLIDKADPLRSIAQRITERTPFYAKAQASVDTDKLSVNEVADTIITLFSKVHA